MNSLCRQRWQATKRSQEMDVPYHLRPYRKNVAAVVLNREGFILTCRRRDFHTTWQLPQGGIEENETAEEAVLRELDEEIGTREVEILGRLVDPICYDWPPEVAHKEYRGQEQVYFLLRLIPGAVLNFAAHPPGEFDCSEWLGCSDFLNRLDRSARGGFKFDAYENALRELRKQFPGVIAE